MNPSTFRLKQIREAVANYIYSEGCGCCRDEDQHKIHLEVLGKLLKVPHKDGSGYDFARFRTNKAKP